MSSGFTCSSRGFALGKQFEGLAGPKTLIYQIAKTSYVVRDTSGLLLYRHLLCRGALAQMKNNSLPMSPMSPQTPSNDPLGAL